jgi:hypothetical protein
MAAAVAWIAIWRKRVEHLRSALSDDQTVSYGGNDLFGDNVGLIHLQDPLNLGEGARQQPEVPPAHSDQRGVA